MTNTSALLQFITDEQLTELLDHWVGGARVRAAIYLRAYLMDKWKVSVNEAYGIIQNVAKEFNL